MSSRVVTSGPTQIPLCRISSGFCVPKIINCSFLAQLFKKADFGPQYNWKHKWRVCKCKGDRVIALKLRYHFRYTPLWNAIVTTLLRMSCGKLELIAAMSTTTAKSSAVALVACAVVGVLSTLWLTSASRRSDTTWPSTLHNDVIACEAGTVSAVQVMTGVQTWDHVVLRLERHLQSMISSCNLIMSNL